MVLKWRQKQPTMGQNGPKVFQKCLQNDPRWSQMVPQRFQMDPKWAQPGPTWSQMVPKWSQEGDKMEPKWYTEGTRTRHSAPEMSKSVPRPLWDRFWTTFGSDVDGFSKDLEPFWLKCLMFLLIHFGSQNESRIEAKTLQQLTKHNETPCPTLGQRAQSKDGRSDREAICGRFAHTAAAE